MRCLSRQTWKILVVFVTERGLCLTYECGRGGFQDLAVLPGKSVGLISFISGDSRLSGAVPREPGAREDQTNRRPEITQTCAAEGGRLLESYEILVEACLGQGHGFPGVISGAARWVAGTAHALPSPGKGVSWNNPESRRWRGVVSSACPERAGVCWDNLHPEEPSQGAAAALLRAEAPERRSWGRVVLMTHVCTSVREPRKRQGT